MPPLARPIPIIPSSLACLDNASRTSSPSSNSTPNQRTIPQIDRHHRHQPSCRPGSSRLGAVGPAGTASAGRCILLGEVRIVLEEDRTGPVAVRRGQAGLVGRGSGCRRSSRVGRRLGCSMRAACRRGLGQHLGALVGDRRVVRLGRMV